MYSGKAPKIAPKKRFAVGAKVYVTRPGCNGVVLEVAEQREALGEYWHRIQTEHGERREPGCNLSLIPKAQTNVEAEPRGELMPSRQSQLPSEPPSLKTKQAIELIKRQIIRLEEIIKLHYDDPMIEAWESTTGDILDKAFGRPQGKTNQKTYDLLHLSGGAFWLGMSEHEIQKTHVVRSQKRKVLLDAYIEQLEDGLAPPVLGVPGYGFHPEIERVSHDLLRNGHYKQAALEAYIRVIEQVKTRSGLPLDGDNLMNHAFGCDGRFPALAFNSLSNDSERDEQRGIMHLFKGIVGLRNAKAHSNTLFSDPSRAHEYLALASLLMRLLEIARKTTP
jgi:uncharacterized protein (TIGR02391 family)